MSLKEMTTKDAATITVTDGTSVTFAEDGISIPNGIHLIASSDTEYKTRRQLTAKTRAGAYDYKTNSYTKDKRSMVLVAPVIDDNLKIVFNTVRLEVEVLPTMSTASKVELLKQAAQLLLSADSEEFWVTGTRF